MAAFIIFKAWIKCNVNELDADIQCTVIIK